MIRQVFLLTGNDIVAESHYAKAYSKDDMLIVLRKLKEYIADSVDQELFNRPLLNFQVVFGKIKDTFYIFVTDIGDRPKYIMEQIKELGAKVYQLQVNYADDLKELFEKPELEEHQDKIYNYIDEVVKKLPPKIAFVGPLGAGKTTLAKMIATNGDEPARKVMTFADVYQADISDIIFDVWDFTEQNFSPLWNNFARGSDLIILVFNATNISKNIIHFITVCKKEGKDARLVTLLSNSKTQGAISGSQFMNDYGGLMPPTEIYEYDIVEPETPNIIKNIIIKTLNLKEPLPQEFLIKLRESNNAVKEENYELALERMDEIIQIAEEHHETKYLKSLRKKRQELKEKWEDQKARRIVAQSQIKAPEQKVFGNQVGIKALPTANPPQNATTQPPPSFSPPPSNLNAPIDEFTQWQNRIILDLNEISKKHDEYFLWQTDIMAKLGYSTQDADARYDAVRSVKEALSQQTPYQSSAPSYNSPSTPSPQSKPAFKPKITQVKHASTQEQKNQLKYEADLLKQYIEKEGKTLRLDLCVKFIKQIRQKIKKTELTNADIQNAAKLYVDKISKK